MDPRQAQPPSECDLAVVGGGILGTAVARELVARHPDARVVVLEAERHLGWHQTGRSSGVIHAGIYYEPGSLKARLCVEGARSLYAFCAEREIPHRRSGKLIVAVDEGEVERLDELERRGRANDVPGLRRLAPGEMAEIEPHARGVAALHSPATGVVDFVRVAEAFGEDVTRAGGSIHLDTRVTRVEPGRDRIAIGHSRGVTSASAAVFCAGLWADRMAVACGAPAEPRIVPFRGGYLRLRPAEAELVRANIYPVPDPELPFLGPHLTRTLDG
jgi:(S)-2-hydroxyglutarate dehydrogenase